MPLDSLQVPSQARRGLVVLVSATLLLAGCSATGGASPAASVASSEGSAATVATKLSEFKIELAAATAPAGHVRFDLTNAGTTLHEFVIFQTDLASDKLPLSADGTEVDEAGAGLTLVSEVEDIEVGAIPNLEADLAAGHYVLICNLPAHYNSGMRADFTTN
jgi:uncharacterized cupredoxin-like copper-binding protein